MQLIIGVRKVKFRAVYLEDFLKNKNYFYEQIPKAQNSNLQFIDDIHEYYIQALNSNQHAFLAICENDGEMIGIACFRYYPELNKFFIVNVNTRLDYQHTKYKIATNVIRFGLENFFKDNQNQSIYLWVNEKNTPAIKAYKRNGFKKSDLDLMGVDFYDNIKNDEIYSCDFISFQKIKNENILEIK